MLTEIRLENFKCFGRLTAIPAARISVFIGPNGSGKSSPIQALMLLKQSLGQEALVTNGDLMNLGDFRDIAYKHDWNSEVTIGLSSTSELKLPEPTIFGNQVVSAYNTVNRAGTLVSHDISMSVGRLRLKIPYDSSTSRHPVPHNLDDIEGMAGIPVSITENKGIGVPLVVQTVAVSQNQRAKATPLWDTLTAVVSTPKNTIRNVYYVPPFGRGFIEPSFELAERSVADFGDVRSPNRQQEIATTLKYREDELQDKLSSWYERVTGIKVRFALREGRTTFVESVTTEGAFNIVNEGFGSNQLAFLLGQLAVAPEDSTVAIEEPEIHLHPKAQYELADVLREAATQENKQLIITTHSEHILHSLLTAVAAGDLTTEYLSVNYFEKKDGVAEVRRLEVDDKGRVKGGLPGFFQAEIDQMDKYIKALSKRK